MTTILIIFLFAILLSLISTPMAGKVGARWGAMDYPNERNEQKDPMPRTGGLSVFIGFNATIAFVVLIETDVAELLEFDRAMIALLLGGAIAFGVGLVDDFKRQAPRVKFLIQLLAASVAFFGGVRIETLSISAMYLDLNVLSYTVTVFWFLLLINAVNLIDGLDGLAGGIVAFASFVTVILSVISHDYLTAMVFAALAGSVLGFLRYNFNPASIHLGDGGSYFLGYTIAAFTTYSSVKSQVSAAILIPIIALGVPLFDTLLSPIRRFLRGKRMFQPDSGHIHHRLKAMGMNTRKVVLTLYGITFMLCLIALAVVNLRDERAGLFLVLLGVAAVFFVRKLGYFEYFATDKIYGWVKDITDEAGFTSERRSFLNLQINTSESRTARELWSSASRAFEMLSFDMVEMKLDDLQNSYPREITDIRLPSSDPQDFTWTRDGFGSTVDDMCKGCLFKLELPLLNGKNESYGTLWLIKDLKKDPITHYTLRRIEHLRRTLIDTLTKLRSSS